MQKAQSQNNLCCVKLRNALLEVCFDFQMFVQVSTPHKVHNEKGLLLIFKHKMKIDNERMGVFEQNFLLVYDALNFLTVDFIFVYNFHGEKFWELFIFVSLVYLSVYLVLYKKYFAIGSLS